MQVSKSAARSRLREVLPTAVGPDRMINIGLSFAVLNLLRFAMNVFYRTLRFICRLGLQIYFKKVRLQGLDRLDTHKPMLIALNHPSSFLEACVMACWLDFPLHFIVRGDVFHPMFRWFFKWTYQIPIYRFRDGFSKLRTNAKTFEHCYQKLSEGAKIIIFAEGSTSWVKQLRPLQKGTARIALGALEQYPDLDLLIVPAGINFQNIFRFRSYCDIVIGEPFQISDIVKKEDEGSKMITNYLAKEMRECVVHLDDHNNQLLFDLIADYKGYFIHPDFSFTRQMDLAKQINVRATSEDQKKAEFIACELRKSGIVSIQPKIRKYHAKSYHQVLLLFYTMTSALLDGPAMLAWWWGGKLSKHPSFVVPIRLALAALLYIFTISLLLILLICLVQYWSILIFSIICFIIYLHPQLYDLNFTVEMSNKWADTKENHRVMSYLDKLTKSFK